LELALQTRAFSFYGLALECNLLYDQSREPVVPITGECPLSYTTEVLNGGSTAKVQVKIKVLSTQYAGQYFVVRIRGLHPTGNLLLSPGLTLDSLPIRVVSKPSSCVPTNHRGKRNVLPTTSNPTTTSTSSSASTTGSNTNASTSTSTTTESQLMSKVNEILDNQHRLIELVEGKIHGQDRKQHEQEEKSLGCRCTRDFGFPGPLFHPVHVRLRLSVSE